MELVTPMETEASVARMLIVEDDPEVGLGLQEFFDIKGYDVTRADDGADALQEITTLPPYDVIILDVMLPSKNGFEILREAREAGVHSPVVMLTVKGQDRDKIHAFDIGADEYVTKPFSAEELQARVEAVLRRDGASGEPPVENYHFGDVEIDFGAQEATREGESLSFTNLEFDILQYFIRHRGRTVSRQQLLRDVWGISGDITTRTIDRHVASLRKKVEDEPSDPAYIKTVYGIGYKFAG